MNLISEDLIIKSLNELNDKLSELYIKEERLECMLSDCHDQNITINFNVTNNNINPK